MTFEGGQLEGNTSRVDAPNPSALKKLKADLAGPEPLPLGNLLAAGEAQFLLVAGMRPAAVDRYYVHAWGLAYYLTFEKHLLGNPALEKYLQLGNARFPPAKGFGVDRHAVGGVRAAVARVYPRAISGRRRRVGPATGTERSLVGERGPPFPRWIWVL